MERVPHGRQPDRDSAPLPAAVEIGQAIRRARRARNVTQEDLAGFLDVPRQAIIRLEAGECPDYMRRLVEVLELLGMDLRAVPR